MKVLICEDDLVVLKTIQVALENENVETVGVKDGLLALEKLRNNTFDLIITDTGMPHSLRNRLEKLKVEVRYV